MGGKDANDQKVRATQDQLRLARITQEVNPSDDDRVMVQKLIKKVIILFFHEKLFVMRRKISILMNCGRQF